MPSTTTARSAAPGLRFGARNLFDKDPPLTSSNYGFNGALHNPNGRVLYVDLSKTF